MTALLALATYLFAFFLLPGWLFLFHSRLGWRFSEAERKERDLWMAAGAILLLLTSYLIWEYWLPYWWKDATVRFMG